MCYKCDKNFMSQFAYILDECIHTSIFNKDKHIKPKCCSECKTSTMVDVKK